MVKTHNYYIKTCEAFPSLTTTTTPTTTGIILIFIAYYYALWRLAWLLAGATTTETQKR